MTGSASAAEWEKARAGSYELVALRWLEITSKPGEPLDFIQHRRGDLVDLDAAEARRLVKAGAVRRPGHEPAAEPETASEPEAVEKPAGRSSSRGRPVKDEPQA